MNTQDQLPDDQRDEDQIASILKTSETDAPPPDAAALARLRGQSTDAFTVASAQPTPMARWRNARWLAAVAAMVLVGVGLYFWLAPGPALGLALDNAKNAETLHARIVSDANSIEFWHTRKPNRTRWDEQDGKYVIQAEGNRWLVNERSNEAQRVKSHSGQANFPLLGSLFPEIHDNDYAALIAAVPVERVRDDALDLFVYRTELRHGKNEGFLVESRVVVKTGRLHSIRYGDKELNIKEGKPFAELTILAYDEPIAAEKFAIADTLTEDGRIGKVTDVQGIVAIKPVLHERWTPVREHLVLRPGDWVRTDARGANATALRLVKQTGVILGPKTLVELIGPKQIRLIEGEIEITPSAGATIELLGPAPQKIAVKGRQLFHVEKEQLVRVEKDPRWLLGFKGVTTNETLGSLVALVDGRNVPLTVGYHKVTVDIRDQIARTVIEESFVNHTNEVLEGVFHFPLPPDASISGFGMWIGDNLVEADVVEKQRAREIYETILREKRDPGLLEWSGGNIFKARVYPIPARSEKRIKIVYTQVLPLKGSRYRYSYALQSELLQQHPLRDLTIDVKVNSVAPLKSVISPTHATRDERTTHSAHVEFTAQSYTPTRDFEVVVELDGRQPDVVMIPHRRGEDGYFLLQLTPLGAAGSWDRPLLPNGDPLHLLILADTSASIDATQRNTQAAFIASLLNSLTPKDRFNLATCDVTCDWAFADAALAEAKNVSAARDYLSNRPSLGWTNLDATFAAALKQMTASKANDRLTHVIYVGDGIVTTGDADPVEFTKRLKRLVQGNVATFHAVTLSSSYETGVMKAIASLGSGSMRKITAEQGPATIARELLGEIAQPALRDIKVEFKGFKVARVYPEAVANVPAGTQQILLGRYLPEGKDQSGEVIVTGTQGGKPVRFSTRATLKDAEHGNSFIPRLWARMHLDYLLEQGASATIRDQIIGLSEEYQIITPYTSFLVLETDADRERFKVQRRFQMRDGERFFADGRDNAVFDLAQKQMKKAAYWRTALRRSVLGELAGLGRDPRLFQPRSPYGRRLNERLGVWNLNSFMDPGDFDGFFAAGGAPGGGGGGFPSNDPLSEHLSEMAGVNQEAFGGDVADRQKDKFNLDLYEFEAAWKTNEKTEEQLHVLDGSRIEFGLEPASPMEMPGLPFPVGDLMMRDDAADFRSINGLGGMGGEYSYRRGASIRYGNWLNTLFPPLHGPPAKIKEAKSTWPANARDLVKGLLRTEQLAKLNGGIEINRQTDSFDTRWDDLASRSRRTEIFSAKSWLTRTSSDGGQTLVSWCDDKETGVFSNAFQLGRVRASTPRDVQPPPLQLDDYSMTSLEKAYASYTPTLEPQGKGRTLMRLKHEHSPLFETRVLIDTERRVILTIEQRLKDKVTDTTTFSDFVEVGGTWWARKVETTNKDGKRYSLVTQSVATLTQAEMEGRTKTELAGRAQVQILRFPMPTVANAKKALATGKAGFDEHFILLLHFYHSQQWPRVLEHLQAAEKNAVKMPGMRWVRSAFLRDSRRHEELRERYQADAARFTKTEPADAYFLTEYVVGQSAGLMEANEMLTLLGSLKPLYEKQPPHVHAVKTWRQRQVSYVSQAGRGDEALRLRKQLATDYPRDYSLQQQYAQGLAGAGDFPGAYAWLTRVLVKESKWLDHEEDTLRTAYTQLLQQQGRYADMAKYLSDWIEQNPAARSAYEQYLMALIKSDQIEQADALVLRWLKDAQIPGELPPPVEARLNAAVQFMLGNANHFWMNRVEERWHVPLGQAALFFARHETQSYTAEQILNNQHFQRSEEAPRVRKKLADILIAEIDKMSPEQARRVIRLVHYDDAEPAAWTKIASSLRERWTKEAKNDVKHTLGDALISVLSKQNEPKELLTFLRLQHQTGPESRRTQYAVQLFDNLLGQPWTADYESEALSLLDKLSDADEPGQRLFSSIGALHRWTDRMIDNRITLAAKAMEHAEKLTRTELSKKQEESRRQAREGVADRLRQEAKKHANALGQWMIAESVYLDVQLDRNLKAAVAEAWEVVGAAPPKKTDEEPTVERTLENVLRQRYLLTLTNIAARTGADAALVERLVKYHEQGVSIEPNRWKPALYRLLIALNRTKELEQSLTQWTRVDDPDNRWRVALGYLLAEQGKLADAIREFEAVEAADELSPAEYRSLSDWYLTQGQREAHERTALAVYKTTPEYQLSQRINGRLQYWLRPSGPLPTELDKEVMRQFAVLFDKSASPQSYLYQLQQFYQASHDFRLLSVLPDAVVGHSAVRVYPFVQGMKSVLDEIRDEATADEMVKRIAETRKRAETTVDKRALDMLEALVERRASEVVNQPGPHKDKALEALVRASKGNWGPGEPRLMADYLASLGKITQTALADEQLRQLKTLRLAETGRGTADSLHIALRHAETLNAYQRRAEAIDLLKAELDEYETANGGVLPTYANNVLATLIGYLEEEGHFARGETLLVAKLANPVHAEQRRWLIDRLNGLYLLALQRDADVSLGKGAVLYQALNAKIQKELADTDQNQRYQLMSRACQVYNAAFQKKIPGVAPDLKKFAFEIAPPLVKEQTNNHESIVSTIAHTVHAILGPRDGIVFLLNEIDAQPRWLRYNRQDGWSRLGNTLADWRLEAKDLGDVEGRLLKLVLAELRIDLETREARSRGMYHVHVDNDKKRFWKEKAADFARTAEAVLAERKQSGAAVVYIAEYLFWGLELRPRAIDALLAAHNQKLLDDEGQVRLVDYLHHEKRFGDSIPVLEPMVKRRPDHLNYRELLMHSYFRTERRGDLLALLKATDAYFHEKDRWGEHPLERLAASTLKNELFEQSVAYYKELIPLHERTHPNRGIGNGTLSNYYTGLANAYAGLKKTPEAVDAAGAAIVAWGSQHSNREGALRTLVSVLERSPDLDAYVEHWDKQKEDSAIIRKALGTAYRQKKEFAKAVVQLKKAVELQPNDAEIHELLVASLDETGDKDGAAKQLLQAVQLSRRELKLYQNLGKRYADANQHQEAERAYTSIVEMQPNEAESHTMLAEIRQKQNRWPDAILHWEHVARLRALEPTGLLKLAEAQIHEKQWDQARETLRKLDTRNWPQRFGNVRYEVDRLRAQLAKEK